MQQQIDDPKDRADAPRWLGFAQSGLILLIIVLALYFARAPERVQLDTTTGTGQEKALPTVKVFQPTSTAQALTVKLTGSVKTGDHIVVRSEVSGRVVWVSPEFRSGGSLAAGEKFVKVDPAQYELQSKAAKSAVKQAEAQLRLETARGNRNRIARAEAELEEARALSELAALELSRTDISFPFAVRVAAADASVGEFVGTVQDAGAGAALGAVYRPDTLQVVAPVGIPELEYLTPAIGRSAQIHTLSGSYEAEIVRISSLVAPQTRLPSLYFTFSDDLPPGALPLPNTFAEIEIVGPVHRNVYILPEAVMQERESVWIVRDNVLQAVNPQVLGRVDAGVVARAFDAGDGVLVGRLPRAREGLEVQVAETMSSMQ